MFGFDGLRNFGQERPEAQWTPKAVAVTAGIGVVVLAISYVAIKGGDVCMSMRKTYARALKAHRWDLAAEDREQAAREGCRWAK